MAEILLPGLASASQAEAQTIKAIREALGCPYRCLRAFYGHYAFARRGQDRYDLAAVAINALRRVGGEGRIEELLKAPDGGSLWEEFCRLCEQRGVSNAEQLNRGIVAGILELAQEIYRLDGQGSIAEWVFRAALQTDRLEAQFLRIVDIRGVGPKTTSTFLRDLTFIYGFEDQLHPIDRIYVQPIDRWIRLCADEMVDELRQEKAPDWVVAGKIAKYARRAGVSGVRLNMGASYFGSRIVRDPRRFSAMVRDLIHPRSHRKLS